MQKEKPDHSEVTNLSKRLLSIEQRLDVIEESLSNIKEKNIQSAGTNRNLPEADFEFSFPFKAKGSLEFGIGEYGMAWLGNIVLLIAITFFVQELHKSGNSLLSVLTGYAAVAGIYLLSYFTRKAYLYLSKLFRYNAHLLLFYFTVRLHFVDNPLIENKTLGLIAILLVIFGLLYFSLRKESRLLTGFILLMMIIAGIISNTTHFLLGISTLAAIITIYLYYRFGWIKLVIFFITIIYFAHLIWLLNNPFITHQAQFREHHEFGFIYLVATGFIFSLLAVLSKKDTVSNDILIFSLIWNGLGFTSLLILTVFTYLSDNYVLIFGLISVFCLIYSFIIQSRSILKIGASIYAIYGFVAMSVAIYGVFLFPKAYTLFAIQSFLVVSMALWFRSRFIVVMNTLLYLLLLIFYIKDPVSYNSANFSFMLVAFITARVINWKKDRLNLKTQSLRNLYLIAGFVMTLIAFHRAIPEAFITVSWICAAVLFLVLSLLLKNIKYRWMAIATLVASAINLLVIDMSNMNIGLRIFIFLLLGIISITVSILYTKFLKKKKD